MTISYYVVFVRTDGSRSYEKSPSASARAAFLRWFADNGKAREAIAVDVIERRAP